MRKSKTGPVHKQVSLLSALQNNASFKCTWRVRCEPSHYINGFALAALSGPWHLALLLGGLEILAFSGDGFLAFSYQFFIGHPGFHRITALGFLQCFLQHRIILFIIKRDLFLSLHSIILIRAHEHAFHMKTSLCFKVLVARPAELLTTQTSVL